jgi:shikimate kinase
VTSPALVLVGPPGAGKTTVGRLVADRLGLSFRDTDLDVVEAAGRPIADIFVDDGEAAFREMEAAAVRAALSDDGVVALGGGAVLDPRTRELLGDCRVVFLSVGLADGVRRVGLSAARPVLALNPRAQLQQLLSERLPLYRAVARAEVPTDGLAAREVVERVLALMPL